MSRKKSNLRNDFLVTTKNIGNRHRQVRKELKLTLNDLADKFGVSQSTLSEYETGKFEFPLSYIVRFCEEYDVNPVWLIWGGELSIWAEEFFKSPPVHIAEAMQRMAEIGETENPYSTVGDVRKYTHEQQKILYREGLVRGDVVKDAAAEEDAERALEEGFLALSISEQIGLIGKAIRKKWSKEKAEAFILILKDHINENKLGEKP